MNQSQDENQSDNTLDTQVARDKLKITEDLKTFLIETTKWARIVAIFGFVSLAYMIYSVIVIVIFTRSHLANSPNSEFPLQSYFSGIFYILLLVAYFFLVRYLFRFSSLLKKALISNNQSLLVLAFENIKNYFKLLVILVAVLVGFSLLFFIGSF